MRCLSAMGIATLFVLLTSCAMLRRHRGHEQADNEPSGPITIGMVEHVNPEARFVLIGLTDSRPVASGSTLTFTGSNGTSGKLKVTPERKGAFLSADIVEGEPAKGDAVMQGTPAPKSHEPAGTGTGQDATVGLPPSVSINPGLLTPTMPPAPLPQP